MTDDKDSFWKTMPGILTGLGTLIGAVAALIAIFYNPNDDPKKGGQTFKKEVQIPTPEPLITIDDSDPRVKYNDEGGWHTDPDHHLIYSTQHYTSTPGATAALQFEGDVVEVYYYEEIGGANMNVIIDGQLKEAIDCSTTSSVPKYNKKQSYKDLGAGRHMIKLTHTGTPTDGRPPRSFGDYTINVDGFGVRKKDN